MDGSISILILLVSILGVVFGFQHFIQRFYTMIIKIRVGINSKLLPWLKRYSKKVKILEREVALLQEQVKQEKERNEDISNQLQQLKDQVSALNNRLKHLEKIKSHNVRKPQHQIRTITVPLDPGNSNIIPDKTQKIQRKGI